MNIWKEPYPANIETLISKAKENILEIQKKINDPGCKRLNELYSKNEKGKVVRRHALFKELGYTPNSYLKEEEDKDKNEFKGLYIFANDEGTPVYVGISRTIFRRLKQHGWGTSHYTATLAYLKSATELKHTGVRSSIDWNYVAGKQELIRNYKVVLLPEEHDYDLYFMEVYIAGQLKTLWNSFRTH